MRDEITFLRSELAARNTEMATRSEALRRAHHLIAALTERLPELPVGQTVQDAARTHTVAPQRDETGRVESALPEPVWRRWWRRVTGG